MDDSTIIELCKKSPEEVYPFLTSHHEYQIDRALKLCQQYKINDATAFLLERTGDVDSALKLYLEKLDVEIQVLWKYFEDKNCSLAAQLPPTSDDSVSLLVNKELERKLQLHTVPQVQSVDKVITQATSLCQRHSRPQDIEGEKLWFGFLDQFVQLQRSLRNERDPLKKTCRNQVLVLKEMACYRFIRNLLDQMMGFVASSPLLCKITTDHKTDSFREFRDTIMSMFDTNVYEQNILETASDLLNSDMFNSVKTLRDNLSAAILPQNIKFE